MGAHPDRCDYCRLPLPAKPVTWHRQGVAYTYCTDTCHETAREHSQPFAEYRGGRRFRPGIEGLDDRLPEGVPRNTFLQLPANPGTRLGSVLVEFLWRALERGEPVVFVTFQEPPLAVTEDFLNLDWNLLPALEDERIGFVDCFTYRHEQPEILRDRLSPWNQHLMELVEPVTNRVRDPTDLAELENKIDAGLEARSMADIGLVAIDSLTEFGTLLQPVQAYNFVKDLRADVCKGRFVPIVAGASYTGNHEVFPHDLEYLVDGIVDLRLTDQLLEGALVKQLRVRKLDDVRIETSWFPFGVRHGRGIVSLDAGSESRDISKTG